MPDTNNSLTAYPFPGMLAYSQSGLLSPDFVHADGHTLVDPSEYPLATLVLDPTKPDIGAIAYSPSLKIYVIADQTTGFWHSTDGILWSRGSKFIDIGYAYNVIPLILQIIFADNKFIAVGYCSAGSFSSILSSDDGVNWTEVAHLTTGAPYIRCVAFGGSRFIAAGQLSGSGAGVSYHSTDGGATWAVGGFTTAATNALAIAYSSSLSLYVIAAGTGKFYTSANDGSWAEKAGTDTSLAWIIWDATNEIFVASGVDDGAGAIVTSADGVTFTPAAYTGATNIDRLIYSDADSLYVATDDDTGDLFTSSDLSAWVDRTTGAVYSDLLFAGASASTPYLAAGGQAYIGLSVDAITWDTPPDGYGISYYIMPSIANNYIKLR